MSLVSASRSVLTRIGHGELLPGQLGKYNVLLELGRGGMATVYLAVTQSAGGVSKLVVLKALLPQFALEAEARAMFLDEARLAAQLNHGNVVQTYEVGEEGEQQVIVMEYLEGQSLSGLLKRASKRGQSLPQGVHLRVLMQVLEGLHYTHELRGYDGIPLRPVHRDISPQNVFITYDGRTKVLDFGIAKAASSTTHTATGLIKGKMAYMSPEQMTGAAVDRRADVYAVGCMLWAAASGSKLWSDGSDVHILHRVMQNAIPTPRSRNSECDPELERITMKALAPAEARYSTALELHDDLERFCEARGIPDRPRELARFMADLFAEDRVELTARIEHELSLVKSGVAPALPESLAHPEAVRTNLERPQSTSSTRTISASTVNALSTDTPASRVRWSRLAAGAGALALLVYLAIPHGRQRGVVAAHAKPALLAPPAAQTKAEMVEIDLRASPSTAHWFVDDKPVPGNPTMQVVPKDGATHRVRAELAGHRTASAQFMATGDQVLELNLEQTPPEQKSERRSSGPRPPQRVVAANAASAAAPKASGCAQPFYFGADGIKRIKPGCL